MSVSILATVLLVLLDAQQGSPLLTFERLVASVPQAPPPQDGVAGKEVGAQEITIAWNAPPITTPVAGQPPAPPPVSSFEVTIRRFDIGALPVHRTPELSADQLVAVGVDARGNIVAWSLLRNPRIIRSEQPGPDGVIAGQVFHRNSAELLVVLPDLPVIVQTMIYEPRWNGREWEMYLLGTADLGPGR